jgi:hypothetical protein
MYIGRPNVNIQHNKKIQFISRIGLLGSCVVAIGSILNVFIAYNYKIVKECCYYYNYILGRNSLPAFYV